MKNIITSILAGVISFVLFYLIGAFVQTSFDITKWSESARVLVGSFGGIVSIFVMASTGLYKYLNL